MHSFKKNRKKILMISITSFIFIFFVSGFAFTWSIYEDTFGKRYDTDVDFNLNLTLNNFPKLKVEKRSFPTNNRNELDAVLYHKSGTTIKTNDFKALIVVSHGIGDGHYDQLPDINALAEAGYLVFAFDNTGSGKSEGNQIKGFPQSIIDLEKALDYIKSELDLNRFPIGLYGYSLGGYSVMNVSHKEYPIKAIIERSGPITSKSIFMAEAYKEVGQFALFFDPFVSLTEYVKFGKIAQSNAVDSINDVDIPMLLMHSKDDSTVPFDMSPVSQESSITNNQVILRVFENGGHDFLMSDKASEYQKKVLKDRSRLREQYDEIPVDIKREFIKNIDLEQLNEINSEIMNEMIRFFDDIFAK